MVYEYVPSNALPSNSSLLCHADFIKFSLTEDDDTWLVYSTSLKEGQGLENDPGKCKFSSHTPTLFLSGAYFSYTITTHSCILKF